MIPNYLLRSVTLLCVTAVFLVPALAAPNVVIIHGEPEYGAAETMPRLGKQLRDDFGYETTVLTSPEGTKNLPDLAPLADADLLILFIRFREATEEQFAQLKAYFDAGKPAIAFRTTSHGFWKDKGWFVPYFGGHYKSHADNGMGTTSVAAADAIGHPILHGVDGEFHVERGGTYNAQPLSDHVTPLLFGKTGDLPAEPVAWTAQYKPGQRLFYTSLGDKENFENTEFQKIVLNACEWCLGQRSGNILSQKPLPASPTRETPAGATALFNGTGLSSFNHYDPSVAPRSIGIDRRADTTSGGPVFSDARWQIENKSLVAQPGFGDIVTKEAFGDSILHVDFVLPQEPKHIKGKFSGNSGIYIDGKYEIQIINSYDKKEPDEKTTCGAIFGVAAPSANACKPPGVWQEMEIAYKHLERGVEISAWLNGTQIHDRVRVESPTVYGFIEEVEEENDEEEEETEFESYAFRGAQAQAANMGSDFTVVVRFRTEDEGPIFSKGKGNDYRVNDKMLYIHDNRLHYDIGSVGVLGTEKDVNDGDWHTAAVRSKGGLVQIFVDGENVGEKKEFAAPDNAAGELKIGAATSEVPDAPWEGEISNFQFFDKALTDQDIELTGASEPIERAKPVLEWSADVVPTLEVVQGDKAKELKMAEAFSIATRFRTHEGGALWSRSPHSGIWAEGGKTLFVDEGTLVYDVGWVGSLPAEDVDVADAEWHIAAVTHKGGKIRMYVDGKLKAERDDFTSKDVDEHVFKVGACSTDFPDRAPKSFRGHISHLGFFNHELNAKQINGLGEGEIPDGVIYNYSDRSVGDLELEEIEDEDEDETEEEDDEEEEELDVELLALQGTQPTTGPLRFQADSSKVRFANIWVSKLGEVDHAAIITSWDHQAFERGKRIYNGLCITCHGNLQQKGSLPTSRPFWKDPFKKGHDPHSLYLTLKNGFEQMPPQPWLTPKQGYDVIHYIREELVKPNNPTQYFEVTKKYLATLPKGLGTESKLTKEQQDFAKGPKYLQMDFGPMLDWTYQVGPDNIAYKGISVRLDDGPGGVSKGSAWLVYDHDTMRVAAAYTGDKFIDWRCIAFDQSHGTHPSIVGNVSFVNPVGPGWARPSDGSWDDPRFRGRDQKPYGPLPRDWAQFKGQYIHGNKVVIEYTVDDVKILELPALEQGSGDTAVFSRTLNIGKASRELVMRVAPAEAAATIAGKPGDSPATMVQKDGFHLLKIPAAATPLNIKVLMATGNAQSLFIAALATEPAEDLTKYTKGGPAHWTETVVTQGQQGGNEKAFEVDEILYPENNPYGSWMRIGGFDFFPDGKRAAVATWLGDVWIVDGIDGELGKHNWKRICTGLFQPLGVKIVDEKIYITCRDQLARLNDLNGDQEIDYIESFNNDHQVTEHFHEFAMGLQTDTEGNFYYAKSARHAKTALVAHHGTLLRVSKDGEKTDILATGFRAANGVCLNPDGTFIVTDQEGHWNPKNRINYVKIGGFYGNMYGYHDVTDSSDEAMEQPLCWITNAFDRSPGELLWVPKKAGWGNLNGHLLNLSYGTGKVFIVPHEKIDGQAQGGMCSMGLDFPTGTMRGRFHPGNGQLYTTGMFAWAGSKHRDGGFYRIRYTGKAAHLPTNLKASPTGMQVTFSDPLDRESAQTADNYKIKIWGLKRTKNYGSKHYNERPLKVASATLSDDGKSVFLEIPDIESTWSMEIKVDVKGSGGEEVNRTIHNTIHQLGGKITGEVN